jgi:cyclohexanone monooxygenase
MNSRAYEGFQIAARARRRLVIPYIGGVGRYRRICEEIVAEGYKGFPLQAKSAAIDRRAI